jgi:acetyl esterase/lipase
MENSINYVHQEKESFTSKTMKFVMNISGVKTALEKGLKKGKIKNDPAPIPSSISKKYQVETEIIDGFKVWTLSPKKSKSDKVIFFFHGGAYVFNVYKQHWQLIDKLIEATGATFVIHDYPLVPQYTQKEAFDFTYKVYENLLAKYRSETKYFVGDSAGAGLALAFAQLLRNERKPLPEQIILSAPWLDVTLENPEVKIIDRDDKMLGIEGLQMAGKAYAGELDTKNYRVSPIYGDFKNLPKISIFIGTHDMFWADAKKLKTKLDEANIPMNYYEYPKMFHNWWIMVGLPETKSVIKQVSLLINN